MTPARFALLRQVLTETFTHADLDGFCKEHLGVFTSSFAGPSSALPDVATALLRWVDQRGREGDLVRALLADSSRSAHATLRLLRDDVSAHGVMQHNDANMEPRRPRMTLRWSGPVALLVVTLTGATYGLYHFVWIRCRPVPCEAPSGSNELRFVAWLNARAQQADYRSVAACLDSHTALRDGDGLNQLWPQLALGYEQNCQLLAGRRYLERLASRVRAGSDCSGPLSNSRIRALVLRAVQDARRRSPRTRLLPQLQELETGLAGSGCVQP